MVDPEKFEIPMDKEPAETVHEASSDKSSKTKVASAHLPHVHHAHRRHHLLHLIHPTGKHFHIVHHPQDIDKRKREVLNHESHGKCEFDVVVYGTPEHLSTIRDIQNHNLQKREDLRSKNEDLFKQFDEVHDTLNHLNDEIGRLTDHAVALDASFSKFGYSAHVRTKDDIESASLHSSDDGDSHRSSSAEERHKDRSMEPIRFFKTPTVRQYFHKGLLWRSARSGEVGTFELFTDLIYVGVIDYVGEAAVTNASAESFLHFTIVFALAYKIWSDLTITVNWFEVEDCVGRLLILFVLCCLYGFNSCVEYFFEYTYTAGISFYLVQRFFMTTFYMLTAFMIPMIRGSMITTATIGLVASVLYIGAIHIEYPYNVAILFPALIIDYGGVIVIIGLMRWFKSRSDRSATCARFSKLFEFTPAINIEHRVERTNAFTTLVFGYSILKSLYQSHAHIGVNAFLGKGMLAVIQAFSIMWLYFDIDGWAIHVHAIRRSYTSATIWVTCHLPMAGAFILSSSTLSDLVLAHDTANADPNDLASAYKGKSVEELEQPMRWFYCGGLAVTLICMTAISATHIHKKVRDPRVSKRFRLTLRGAVAIIIACLPLAHHLSSLELIGITCSLIVAVLIFDIYGNSCDGERFWTGGIGKCPDTRCKYVAKMKMGKRKKEMLEKKLMMGEEVKLDDALRRTGSTDSSFTANSDEQWATFHV